MFGEWRNQSLGIILDKEVLFRLDAGKKFGMGHLSRNLALAEVFSAQKTQSKFLIHTDDEVKVLSFLKSRNKTGYDITFINEDIDSDKDVGIISQHYVHGKSFLILDHYDHDLHYQEELRSAGVRWAQFDYKIEDQIIADIVINPNVGVKDSDYDGLIGSQTNLCVGEKFAIIGEDFKKAEVKPQLDRILIAMGGGYYPQDVVDMIATFVSDMNYRFDLITTQGLFNTMLKEKNNVEIHNNPKSIADIYARNHTAVVAGGVTTYELAYLNIPMIIVPYSVNQLKNAIAWQLLDHAISFSTPVELTNQITASGVNQILTKLNDKYSKDQKTIDGFGAKRVCNAILKI